VIGEDTELGATVECTSGKLHVAAQDTLDAWGTLDVDAPAVPYWLRVAARIAVTAWDGGRVLWLEIRDYPYSGAPFELRAGPGDNGFPAFSLCSAAGCSAEVEVRAGEEHLFVIDVRPEGTTATIDCQPLGTAPSVELRVSAVLHFEFGKLDAAPIDGTLDDLVISLR
jgi:hypothetical protein